MFPENKNYVLGSGELYFSPFIAGTRQLADGGAQQYFGNTPEINITTEREMLDHYDADHGIRTKDDSALLELNRTGTFTCDHISPDNLAKWFLGEADVVTQASATAQTYTIVGAKRGRRYQIGQTDANPQGLRALANVSAVMVATPSNVTLVAGTDFRVDLEAGAIYFLSTGAVVPEPGGDEETVTVTFDITAESFHRVRSGSNAQLEGALYFHSYNGKGAKFDYLFPYVQLAPEGDLPLKGEDWQVLSYGFEILKKDDATEAVYTNGRPGIYVD